MFNPLNLISKIIKGGSSMSVFITLGTYSNEGAGGLVEGKTDRRAVMETFHSSVGAKLLDYHITRGKYDFCAIVEAASFNKPAINIFTQGLDAS